MNNSITIGFDAKRIVRNNTGLGSYGRTLIRGLAYLPDSLRLRLYAPDKGRDDLRAQVEGLPRVSLCYPKESFLPFDKALWRDHGIVRDLKKDHVQVYHGLSGELPRGIRRSGIRSVVTIHDLIFIRHPEFYPWIDAKIYAWKFRRTLKEADHIIAISQCTCRDVLELGNVDPSRISVVYQSCAPRFTTRPNPVEEEHIRMKYGLPRRFVLNVGTIEQRKNILLAVKALEALPSELSLVIVGRYTPYTNQVLEYISSHNLSRRVYILNDVPDADLPALYAQAEVFVYPSIYEGFGIPVIEAVSCGLPVVACTGSCLEEAGGPDCRYVSPYDPEALADAIRLSMKGSPDREERIRRSQDYIRRFQGDNVASQVAAIYQKLL
jgi:glycosyltransferase involved in cell wall biosynthesis